MLAHDTERTETRQRLVDATFAAHPSRVKIPGDVAKVVVPMSVAAGELDERFPRSQVDDVEAILRMKTEKGGGEHEVVWYEGARHGFGIRGSETDGWESECGRRAEEQAIRWFQRQFSSVKYRYE